MMIMVMQVKWQMVKRLANAEDVLAQRYYKNMGTYYTW